MLTEKLWVEKYRPQTIDECILPPKIKRFFKSLVEQGSIPNLLLEGDAGCGKTTVAKALCHEMDMDYIFINGSESGNIDTLRTTIRDYVSTVSLNDKNKVVILDEADYLNPQSTQPALRGFMEEFTNNARFILTCNFRNKILKPLQSRCSHVSFEIPTDKRTAMAKKFVNRLVMILKEEEVEFEMPALVQLVKKFFPDYRKIINELNKYAKSGSITDEIFTYIDHTPIKEVVGYLKEKNYKSLSTWVEVTDFDMGSVFGEFHKNRFDIFKEKSLPDFDLIAYEAQIKAGLVDNPKIHLQGFLVSLMKDCEFV